MSNERTLKKQMAANTSWARTEDRAARTHKARMALEERFLREAGGDPLRAESVRKAYYQGLALKSIAARKAKRHGVS